MAAKYLVIVESPAKAKTLGKYLGRDFPVKAPVGHVVDLPKSKLGVDIKNGFAPDLRVIPGKNLFVCDRYPQCRFTAWDRPVVEACPKCEAAILLEKVTRRAGRVRRCHKEECDYTVQVVE